MTQLVADTPAGARLISDGDQMSDAGESRSGTLSAISGPARTELRTRSDRRPPRQYWDQSGPRRSSWQLTTRPPRVKQRVGFG